jgi:hypothetical protein
MGWALLLRMEDWPALLQSALSIFWLGMLGFPVGFWARRRWESLCALSVFAATVVVLPPLVGLLPTPALQLLGGIAGVGLGVVLARVMVVGTQADPGVAGKPH